MDELFGLGIARAGLLLIMVAALASRSYALKSAAVKATADERQSLLENGQGPAAQYNGNAQNIRPAPTKPKDPKVSWFDYFAGFRVLFPYLW